MKVDKSLQGVSGIYQINVKTKNKVYTYIGSSVNIYYRLHGHLSDLGKNQHGNIILQRLYEKYGLEKFSYEILESAIEKEKLAEREQYFINLNSPVVNIKKDVIRNAPNPESNKKIAKTLREKFKLGEIKDCGTPIKGVKVYDLDGNFIKECVSITETSKEFGTDLKKISACCLGDRKSTGGYQFRFSNSSQDVLPLPQRVKNLSRSWHYDLTLTIEETKEIIEIKNGVHGLYKYFSTNLYNNPNLSYTVKLAPVKLGELLENPKTTNTTTELETTDVTVEKLIDIYNGQSATKALKTN